MHYIGDLYDEAQLLTVDSNGLPYHIRVGVSIGLRQIHAVYSNALEVIYTQRSSIFDSQEIGPTAPQRSGIWLRGWGDLKSVQKPVSWPPVCNLLQLHNILSLVQLPH